MSQLQMISFHIMLTPDEYTLRHRIVESISPAMHNHLIDYKGLSTTTSTVVEWVDAIEDRELELWERAAYDEATAATKRPPTTQSRTTTVRTRPNPPRSSSQAKPAARMSDRAKPSGAKLPPKQTVPLAEITCHACSKKGHYKGSQECPHTVKPPSSARLHAMGFDQNKGKLLAPGTHERISEPAILAVIESAAESASGLNEDPFEGQDYDGDADIELADEEDTDEQFGEGAIVAGMHIINDDDDDEYNVMASIHIVDNDEDEDEVVYMAAMAMSSKDWETDDSRIAEELLTTIKGQYEERGSRIKPKPRGPSANQLRANSQKEWASNANVRDKDPKRKK